MGISSLIFDWSWIFFRAINDISRKFIRNSERRFILWTVPWLAKILKVKALIVGASSLNIVEFGQNFNDS